MLLEVADITRSLVGSGEPDIHYWCREKKKNVFTLLSIFQNQFILTPIPWVNASPSAEATE